MNDTDPAKWQSDAIWQRKANAVADALAILAAPSQKQAAVNEAVVYLSTMTNGLSAHSEKSPGRAAALADVERAKVKLVQAQEELSTAMTAAQALIAAYEDGKADKAVVHAFGGAEVAAASTDMAQLKTEQALSHLQWETTLNHLQQEDAAAESNPGSIW